MGSRYGLPYMGSKNSIAEKVISCLPKADNLYDLFCGGCAITHCSMLQQKYKNYYINDVNTLITKFFINCVNGKYKNKKRWISREEFFKLKDNDPYVAYCWSFGNKATNYLYSKEKEPIKRALWYAIFSDNYKLLDNLGIHIKKVTGVSYYDKYLKIKKQFRLQSLERLQSLQSLQDNLIVSNLSYEKVEIKDNSVVYCDIPYENTAKYKNIDFDNKTFYEWAYNKQVYFNENNKNCKIFISSYNISDNRFKRIKLIEKNCTLQSGGDNLKEEGVYIVNV